jgi:hypothetical protein
MPRIHRTKNRGARQGSELPSVLSALQQARMNGWLGLGYKGASPLSVSVSSRPNMTGCWRSGSADGRVDRRGATNGSKYERSRESRT